MKPVVVIPAYNEGRTIAGVIARCLAVIGDVIVVDDGSSDDTAAIAGLSEALLLRQGANGGKASAMVRGNSGQSLTAMGNATAVSVIPSCRS